MKARINEYKEELEKQEQDANSLRADIEILNNKLIQIEEENFTSKRIQLDQEKQLDE